MSDLYSWLNDKGLHTYTDKAAAGMWDNADDNRRATELQNRDSLFRNTFEQFVGRAPTDGEMAQMFGQIAPHDALYTGSPEEQGKFRDITKQFVGDTFQKQAQDYTNHQLEQQQGQANQLADLFRTQGRQAINDTESGLLNYQQKLFEKLRPNLITSLQAQGLLNTGGLNDAMAGAQEDFANNVQGSLMDARLQNEQQANAIAFSGASAPYQFNQSQILNSVPYMQQQAQGSLNNLFQQRLADQQFQNQMGLLNRQAQINRDSHGMWDTFNQAWAQEAGTGWGKGSNPIGASEGFKNFGQGVGGMMGGGGGGGGMMSSKHYKKNIDKLSVQEEDALYNRLMEMPLYKWHYKTEDDNQARHLGTITQEAIPEIVAQDGEHLSPIDYFGVLTLALKVQHRRMNKAA